MASRSARKRIAAGIAAVLGGKIRVPKRPRPYQRDALAAVGDWLKKPTEPRAHVAHATGLGKTVLFSCVAAAMGEQRLLVVVPTKPLLVQTARVLSGFANGQIGHVSSLGKIDDGDGETIATRGIAGSQIVVTTNASLRLKGEQIAREFAPELVVYDECHWSYTDEIQGALKHFGETPMLGVSATPDFMGTAARAGYVPVTLDNGQVLYGPRERFAESHFGRRLDERTVRWGIENGWLAPLAWGLIQFDVSLDDLRTQDGVAGADYNEQDLHELLGRNWSAMVDTIRRLYRSGQYELAKRQVFSVCHSVAAAEELADAIRGVGVPSAVVVGTTDDDERDEILTRYRRHRIRFLSSVMVLREGWDSPNAEVCMMLRPTKSRVLYQQIMGRVLRKMDGRRKTALVLDARFQNTEFSPLCTPMLFGKPGSEIPVGGIILGPRKGGGGGPQVDGGSPYLPKGAKPRLVVVEALKTENWASQDGTLEADGEVWGPERALARILGVSDSAIDLYVQRYPDIRSRMARALNGKLTPFYALSDLRRVMADILQFERVQSVQGEFEEEGEVWGTDLALAEHFGVSYATIRNYAKKNSGVRRVVRRISNGNVTTFFSKTDVGRVLQPLLVRRKYSSGESDQLDVDGERWVTTSFVVQQYSHSVERRLLKDCPSIRKLDGLRRGRPVQFFALKDVREVFGEPVVHRHLAGEDGFIRHEDEEWGLDSGVGERLGVSRNTVRKCVEKNPSVRRLSGFNARGAPGMYYSVKDVEAATERLRVSDVAGGDGTFDAVGETWIATAAAARKLGLPKATIRLRLSKHPVRSREGVLRGIVTTFYALLDVKKACADLLRNSSRQKRKRG